MESELKEGGSLVDCFVLLGMIVTAVTEGREGNLSEQEQTPHFCRK
jgi:hypothetical protein